ncbi:hypothetical protein [Pontibacter roseus]|uniref:hypothetical protein n=1 Tax=Pontibacter roseus TaxID=336989 RepID=UPI00035D0444|nr:hypothetical protein [Pontibacter roseus]
MKNKFSLPLLLVLLLISTPLLAQEVSQTVVRNGLSTGTAIGVSIAVVTSWTRNRSILWAILHGFFNWFYVIYFSLTRLEDER